MERKKEKKKLYLIYIWKYQRNSGMTQKGKERWRRYRGNDFHKKKKKIEFVEISFKLRFNSIRGGELIVKLFFPDVIKVGRWKDVPS